jgi:spore coat protein U-like protein
MNRSMGRLIAGATTAAVMAGIVGYSQKTEAAFSAPVNVAISANVAANCVLTAGSVAFGAYEPLGAHDTAPLDQTGTFMVRCVKGVTANVGLNDGLNFSGTRRMSDGGTNFLGYELFQDSGRLTAWTNTGTGRVSYTAANKTAATLTIYGRIPGNQDAGAGSYTDTVVAVAEF